MIINHIPLALVLDRDQFPPAQAAIDHNDKTQPSAPFNPIIKDIEN